jgi:hypothetical protein
MKDPVIVNHPLYDGTMLLNDFYDRDDLEIKYRDIDPDNESIIKDIIRSSVIDIYDSLPLEVKQRAIDGLKFVILGEENWARSIWDDQYGSFRGPSDCRMLFKWVLEIACEHDKELIVDWEKISIV